MPQDRPKPALFNGSFLQNGPLGGPALILAHGAGAPMDSPFMEIMAGLLGQLGICAYRFEFSYMAGRREGATKRPPPNMDVLIEEYARAMETVCRYPLFIGGKSMGGRVATKVAAEPGLMPIPAGVVCLGYPFHPPGKPEKLRIAHLNELRCDALVVQGERDQFGNRSEVEGYLLGERIRLVWIPDGNHGLEPRKRSGHSFEDNCRRAADAIATFIRRTLESQDVK
jgi:predicted alpha/beta-hydrolase family hydrolase